MRQSPLALDGMSIAATPEYRCEVATADSGITEALPLAARSWAHLSLQCLVIIPSDYGCDLVAWLAVEFSLPKFRYQALCAALQRGLSSLSRYSASMLDGRRLRVSPSDADRGQLCALHVPLDIY